MERYEPHGVKVGRGLFSITAPPPLQALPGHLYSGMPRMASHSLSRMDAEFLTESMPQRSDLLFS
jgi:hypothetical protein